MSSQSTIFVGTPVNQHRLKHVKSTSIRTCLDLHDQYSQEIQERKRQLTTQKNVTVNPVRPVIINIFVETE